eukprot:TRINITY_DN7783_c0_g1_i3.p1 TRINITY_DN7783_c0_g1~~TRINITY_DN7783_c0_g1_i3.p1  ORF type:complete len:107 (-),score=37.71 TRINITY_DN7783_c0_g1_i3:78-398(-)
MCIRDRRKNTTLCEQVVGGDVTPEELCHMSSKELASEETKARRKVLEQEAIKNAAMPHTQEDTTDQWICAKCNKRECTYYQLQTKESDEPMTIFITCQLCGHKWNE